MSASDANSRLWHCRVPADATDVWYTSAYRGTRVECNLKPESFEVWCHRQGWRPISIGEDEPAYVLSERDGMRILSRGFWFDERRGDVGCAGHYDVGSGRAYVTFSGG